MPVYIIWDSPVESRPANSTEESCPQKQPNGHLCAVSTGQGNAGIAADTKHDIGMTNQGIQASFKRSNLMINYYMWEYTFGAPQNLDPLLPN